MTRRSLVRRRAICALALLALYPLAAAADFEVRILLDLDAEPATGCSVATSAGVFPGVEQMLVIQAETTASPPSATVIEVAVADCVNPVSNLFGPPSPFDGGWPIGLGTGPGGLDVVEAYFPLAMSLLPEPSVVRLGVVVAGPSVG